MQFVDGSRRRLHRAVALALMALLLPVLPGAIVRATVPPASAAEADAPIGARFILSASDGRTVSDADFRGKHLLVFFGYTHCPDVCPTSLMTMTEAMDLLGPLADQVQPLFVTVDPERDNKSVLAAYLGSFHPRILGLTGQQAMIDRVADGYRVIHDKVTPAGAAPGSYSIDHTVSIFHMGPDGSYIGRFAHAASAEEIAGRLREVIAQRR